MKAMPVANLTNARPNEGARERTNERTDGRTNEGKKGGSSAREKREKKKALGGKQNGSSSKTWCTYTYIYEEQQLDERTTNDDADADRVPSLACLPAFLLLLLRMLHYSKGGSS